MPPAETATRSTRSWLRPRPAEWVLLLALGYLGIRMLLVSQRHSFEPELPDLEIAAAILAVVTARSLVEYRRTPWPGSGEAPRFAQLHRLLLPICLLPFAVMLVYGIVTVASWWPKASDNGGALATAFSALHHFLRLLLFVGPPGVVVWVEIGQFVKRRGAFSARQFVADAGARFVDSMREWLPPVALIYTYGLLGEVLEFSSIPDRDAVLMRIDRALFFGHDPVQALQHIVWAPLSEWLAFCYSFYVIAYAVVFGALYVAPKRTGFRELAFSVTFALAVGYVGYTLVPAQGPLFTESFSVNLDLYYLRIVKEALMDRNRVPRDCFPSLHTGVALLFLWSGWRHSRKMFWVLLPVLGAIPFACVYLRYHYVVDILAGCVLAAVTAWIAQRVVASYEARLAHGT